MIMAASKQGCPQLQLREAALWIVVLILLRPISCSTDFMTAELECLRTSDPILEQRLRLEAVKHEILLRLGLDVPPPNPVAMAPDPMLLEEYQAAQKVNELTDKNEPCVELGDPFAKELEVFFPKSVEERYPIVHPTETVPPSTELIVDTYRLKFDIDIREKSYISKAELRFYKTKRPGGFDTNNITPTANDRVEVYLIAQPDNYYGRKLRVFISALYVSPEREGYTVFNVSQAIDSWINYNPDGKVGELELEVFIRCPEALQSGIMFRPNIQFIPDNATTQLVLTSLNEEHVSEVNKRAARFRPQYCEENPNAYQCCLRPLTIHFERDFNWTWIIEPKSIPFNYCKGACPHNWNFYSEHSDLISRLRENNPSAAPEPCCVANSYDRRMILTHIEGRNRLHTLEDVLVRSCVCK